MGEPVKIVELAKKLIARSGKEVEIEFSGLREGLKLMKEGESITFIFPSQKAYGYYGDENKIGRNVPLICEVSLLKLTNN